MNGRSDERNKPPTRMKREEIYGRLLLTKREVKISASRKWLMAPRAISHDTLPANNRADADHPRLKDAVRLFVRRAEDVGGHVADDRVRVVDVEDLKGRRHRGSADLEVLRHLEIELRDPLDERGVVRDERHTQLCRRGG